MDPTTLMSIMGMSNGSQTNPVLGKGLGIAQLLTGIVQQRKANKLYPDVPPMYYDMLNDYKRKARNTAVGGLYSTMLGNARQMLAQGSNAVMQTGNPMAYSFSQRRGASAINEMLANMAQRGMGYEQMAGQVGDTIANTRFQLDTNKWANMQQRASSNLRSGIDNLMMSFTGKGMKGNSGGTNTTQGEGQTTNFTPEQIETLQKVGLMTS